MMVAVVQLSIGLGSTIGGVVFDSAGYQSTFFVSAIVLVIGGLLAIKNVEGFCRALADSATDEMP
ncbi:hypothetical protein ASF13_21200 [Erwinia sp. Leaf53]|nr:MFS transporter [Erwinia sp. Leaf53]KQN62878.1 hypothetical protein ASF13_21200 [Erwinia sp. Leaf53]